MGFSYSQHLEIKQGMSVKQMQHLMMTHQMQQSLRFLQLPYLELSQEVHQILIENPLVDLEETFLVTEGDRALFSRLEKEVKGRFNESLREENLIERYLPHKISLFEHLMNQARCCLDQKELKKAEEIIGHIDQEGFIDEKEIPLGGESILKVIQTFDPIGVGARSLQECFLIQLRSFGKEKTLSYQVILHFFDQVLKNQWSKIAKGLGVEESVLREEISCCIKRLQVSPTARFLPQAALIVPDFTVISTPDDLRLELKGESVLPSFSINQNYLNYLKETTDKGERDSILENLQGVKTVIRSLNERKKTLEALGNYLIEKQRAFFLEEGGQIFPETMKEVAVSLRVHESTVARAVSNKYLECSKGLFPLKYFFTTKYLTDEGEVVSSKAIEELLIDLVNREDKSRPYSDEYLAKLLKDRGFQVARRTVAKFREGLKMGNCRQRRRG